MLIYVKGSYTILGKIWFDRKGKTEFEFAVPSENQPPAIVTINLHRNSAESLNGIEPSQELLDILQRHEVHEIAPPPTLPKPLQDELSQIKCRITDTAKKVLHLIKYCLHQTDLNESLISSKAFLWSTDKSEWKMFPKTLNIGVVSEGTQSLLYEKTAQAIQEYIYDGFEPLVAMRHLHRARNEAIPRYKWIDATIAAELAIKEFFIKYRPELKDLLLEVPSPPLHKLYGSILESYAGQRSPKVSEIAKGVEIRNKLLHKPEDIPISRRQAAKYVNDIESAIYHLMDLLYPADYRIRDACSVDTFL